MASTLDLMNTAQLAFHDNFPTALLIQATAQSIANNTDTAITFTGVTTDNWSGWSSGSNTRYTFQVPGVYFLSGSVAWGGNATGRRYTYLRINGSTQVPGSAGDYASSSSNTLVAPTPTVLYPVSAGDYVELMCNQNTGGSLSTNGSGATSAFIPSLSVRWVHW